MEIEIKYSIPGNDIADQIWNENCFKSFGEVSLINTKVMKAVYFDTEDRVLRQHDVAYRIRLEGNKMVATLKWSGTNDEGLYAREELNIPVTGEDSFMRPSLEPFQQDPNGREFMRLVGDSDLSSVVETNFIRRSLRLDAGDMICEIAIDTGRIITDNGTSPICEMEIEFFSGRKDAIVEIGEEVAKRYNLTRGQLSKFSRGWAMLNEEVE